MQNCNFINNTARYDGGAITWGGANGTINDCTFTDNSATQYGGGAVRWYAANGTIIGSTFTGNTAPSGGSVWWDSANNGANGIISDCNFINNAATTRGGAVYWYAANGTIIGSTFTGNTAPNGGSVYWQGSKGILSSSTFTNNVANGDGGAICWTSSSGRVSDSIFINNTASQGGAFYGTSGSYYLTLTTSTFINNTANSSGGIRSEGHDSIFSDCTFTSNSAINGYGGAAYMGTNGANNILTGCTFDNNIASSSGGAIYFSNTGSIINCSFNNRNWIKSNGISAGGKLKIDGGKGIVDIVTLTQETISGISIVVLNNETYYYPPSSNINLADKFKIKEVDKDRIINSMYDYLSRNI